MTAIDSARLASCILGQSRNLHSRRVMVQTPPRLSGQYSPEALGNSSSALSINSR